MADKNPNLNKAIEMAIQIGATGAAFNRRLKEPAGSKGECQQTVYCEQE